MGISTVSILGRLIPSVGRIRTLVTTTARHLKYSTVLHVGLELRLVGIEWSGFWRLGALINIAVRIDEELYAEIEQYAKKHGLKLSEVIRPALAIGIAENPDLPKILRSQALTELNYRDEAMLRKYAKRLKSLMFDNLEQTLAVLENSNFSDKEKRENEAWFRDFDRTAHSRGDELRKDGRRIMRRIASREKKIKKLNKSSKRKKTSKKELIDWILDKQEELFDDNDGLSYTREELNKETTSALKKIKKDWSEEDGYNS